MINILYEIRTNLLEVIITITWIHRDLRKESSSTLSYAPKFVVLDGANCKQALFTEWRQRRPNVYIYNNITIGSTHHVVHNFKACVKHQVLYMFMQMKFPSEYFEILDVTCTIIPSISINESLQNKGFSFTFMYKRKEEII